MTSKRETRDLRNKRVVKSRDSSNERFDWYEDAMRRYSIAKDQSRFESQAEKNAADQEALDDDLTLDPKPKIRKTKKL